MAVNVTPGRWIGMGWGIFKKDVGTFILITLIALALTSVGSFVVAGPLMAGMFIAVKRRIMEGRTDMMDLFAGFNLFIDTFLVCILTSLFGIVGLALCIVPVLVVAAFYLFAYVFVVDRKLSFWDAMESSRKVVVGDLVGYIFFVLLLILLNFVGLLLLGIGLLVTLPVSVAAVAVAYQEAVGFIPRPPEHHGAVHIP
jgi:uncharacterized membrane protein